MFKAFVFVALLLLNLEYAWGTDLSQSLDKADRPAGVTEESGVIRFGPIAVHPYLILKETYSDNIYSVRDDKKSDFYTTIHPGVYLELPIRAHTLSLTANLTDTRYATYTSENSTDYEISANGNFRLGNRLAVKLWDNYNKGHEPRAYTSAASPTTEVVKFNDNIYGASVTYLLAQVSKLQVEYSHERLRFETANFEFRSRDEDLISGLIYNRIMPKTSIFAGYDFKQVRFVDKNLDNNVHRGYIGFLWEASARSNATIKGGFLLKKFEDTAKDKIFTWTASADIKYDFNDRTTLTLIGKRDVNEAAIEGTRYYILTGIYTALTHNFLDRLNGVARLSYQVEENSDIVPGDPIIRIDKTWLAGLGLRYFMRRWLELALDYSYRIKRSNIATYDNDENLVSLTIQAAF